MSQREITGRHVFLVAAGAFGLIIAVNVLMAVKAVGTFPGLETKNSYVASQSFDARRAAQEALGWQVASEYGEGALRVSFTDRDGRVVRPASVSALIGRPTIARDDQTPELLQDGSGYSAPVELERGLWSLKLTATAEDGTLFEKRIDLRVR